MNQVSLTGRVCSHFIFKTTRSGTNLYKFHLTTNDDGTHANHNISTNSLEAFQFIEDNLDRINLILEVKGKLTYSKNYTNILAYSIQEIK